MTVSPNIPYPFADQQSWKESYELVRPEFETLQDHELQVVNLDIVAATATVLGVWPRLRVFRGELAKLAGFDLAMFDKLPDYVQAVAFAHTEHVSASMPSDEFRHLQEMVQKTRDLFALDARHFAARGLIGPETLRGLRGGNGYRNQVADLAVLVHVFQRYWDRLDGKCALTQLDLIHAENLVALSHRALGERGQNGTLTPETAIARTRAFTLFLRAYQSVRRAITYLRWEHGDAEVLAPSLYAGKKRRASDRDEETVDAPPVAPAAPTTKATAPSATTPAAIALSPVVGPFEPGGPFLS